MKHGAISIQEKGRNTAVLLLSAIITPVRMDRTICVNNLINNNTRSIRNRHSDTPHCCLLLSADTPYSHLCLRAVQTQHDAHYYCTTPSDC